MVKLRAMAGEKNVQSILVIWENLAHAVRTSSFHRDLLSTWCFERFT